MHHPVSVDGSCVSGYEAVPPSTEDECNELIERLCHPAMNCDHNGLSLTADKVKVV